MRPLVFLPVLPGFLLPFLFVVGFLDFHAGDDEIYGLPAEISAHTALPFPKPCLLTTTTGNIIHFPAAGFQTRIYFLRFAQIRRAEIVQGVQGAHIQIIKGILQIYCFVYFLQS